MQNFQIAELSVIFSEIEASSTSQHVLILFCVIPTTGYITGLYASWQTFYMVFRPQEHCVDSENPQTTFSTVKREGSDEWINNELDQ